jgi:hypothetical protein
MKKTPKKIFFPSGVKKDVYTQNTNIKGSLATLSVRRSTPNAERRTLGATYHAVF